MQLGELLLSEILINEPMLAKALEAQSMEGGPLSQIMLRLGYVTHDELYPLLNQLSGVPLVDPNTIEIGPAVVAMIPAALAHELEVLPTVLTPTHLTVAIGDPTNTVALERLKQLTGHTIEVVGADIQDLWKAINRHYPRPRR